MTEDRIDILADKWLKGTITTAERKELETWYASYESHEQEVSSDQDEEAFGNALFHVIAARAGIEPALIAHDAERVTTKIKIWPRISAVAAVVALIVLGAYFFNAPSPIISRNSAIVNQNDVAPGKNGATITLANGEVIQLSDNKTGVVIGQDLTYSDGTEILRSALNDKSNNDKSNNDKTNNDKNNNDKKEGDKGGVLSSRVSRDLVASTTKGQTYQFTLSDGTRVWLNAASKLKFPFSFSSKSTRTVELEGEGYFEVAKDSKHPFVVVSNGQEVKVLGTHFNVSAYGDETSIKTTLLEGSVKVQRSRQGEAKRNLNAVVLKPNQQSIITNSDRITVKQVDPESAVAWKNGGFIFNEENLSSIMRQIERWYNVEVDYSTVPDTRYYGAISRNVKLSKVLEMLEQTGNLKLRIEKNVIKVYQ